MVFTEDTREVGLQAGQGVHVGRDDTRWPPAEHQCTPRHRAGRVMAVAVARSDSMMLRGEDSGVATSSGAEQQPPAGRPISTIRQHYYPESGWGWVVVVCSVLVQILCHGLHGAAGVWLQVVQGHFPEGLLPAGT